MDTTLSLSSFRPAEKRWNWRSLHTLSYLTQRVLCRIGGIRRSPLICGSHVMHWHATSCTGRERARSGMEGQGRSCRRGAIAADGGVRTPDYSNRLNINIGDTRGKIAILLERACYSWERRLPWSPFICCPLSPVQPIRRPRCFSDQSAYPIQATPRPKVRLLAKAIACESTRSDGTHEIRYSAIP